MYSGLMPNLLRAFCREFEDLRDRMVDPCGGSHFRNGLSTEDGKVFARMLSQPRAKVKAHELACHVCRETKVVQLEWYFAGNQDSDAEWITLCVISGRKVKQKNSGCEVYICHECLRGRDELRKRVAETMEPILQRFDELSF